VTQTDSNLIANYLDSTCNQSTFTSFSPM